MNKDIFAKDATNTTNNAGGKTYQMTPKQALAQLVSTGTLNQTFYANAQPQLDEVIEQAQQVDSDFLAKLSIYGRHNSKMKDMPVVLLALLSMREDGQQAFKQSFKQVIDNGKQLRNFVQVMRSGVVGRKSLGSMPKKMVNQWLCSANDYRYVSASIGNAPSLKDVLKISHPKPADDRQEALFRWTMGKEYDEAKLPELVQQLLAFQADNSQPLPNVPLQMLMALDLTTEHWVQIAKQGSWQMLRMNLNTFARHGVFEVDGMTALIADKLTDKQAIKNSRCFPYQLYTTWSALDCSANSQSNEKTVPKEIKQALATAMDTALANVPKLEGNVVVAVDVSGSMSCPVTGYRRGATSVVRCVDAGALFASAIKRVNPHARIMPFDTALRHVKSLGGHLDMEMETQIETETTGLSVLKQRISFNKRQRQQAKKRQKQIINSNDNNHNNNAKIDVFKLADELARLCGGGTNTSIPLSKLNQEKADVDVMIYFSDNESWADNQRYRNTQMMKEWDKLKARNPNVKLICVDVQPYTSTQAQERKDILNIGGFGDEVFRIIGLFAEDKLHPNHWVNEVEQVRLAS